MDDVQTIEKGHGLTDVSCEHGSRWIWWYDEIAKKGRWQNVVWACNCDCGEPPDPFLDEAAMLQYLEKVKRSHG